jgi:hypothetical protein
MQLYSLEPASLSAAVHKKLIVAETVMILPDLHEIRISLSIFTNGHRWCLSWTIVTVSSIRLSNTTLYTFLTAHTRSYLLRLSDYPWTLSLVIAFSLFIPTCEVYIYHSVGTEEWLVLEGGATFLRNVGISKIDRYTSLHLANQNNHVWSE